MESEQSNAYQVVWLIRRLFRALGQKSNESLKQFGISAADRAVLEFLYPEETLSVPGPVPFCNLRRFLEFALFKPWVRK